MIDKNLVKKRFKKSLKTYDDNAIIQKYTAEKLIERLKNKRYDKILEIGCSTGVLTRQIKKNLDFEKLTVNDIVPDAEKYVIKIVPEAEFIEGDIEEIPIKDEYDLIISNACLQWCNDFEGVIEKLYNSLKENGVLLVCVFGKENLKEISSIFNLSVKGFFEANLLEKYKNIELESEIKKVYFETPKEILAHIKNTGANALKECGLTKSQLQNFEKIYKTLYSEGDKVYLTYNPVYIEIVR